MAYTDGNIIIGTSVDMYGMNTGLKKIEKSVKKLKLSLGAALGIGVFSFGAVGKAALDAASDLQEVQNIVDVAFGDMAYMANNFADVAIEKFGMSELAAKQTAGSFMAMGKALGIAQEDAAKMAIRLTALTGDMASFYNISQEYARVALSAVYTGETETLKRYGIVLTEANLQEYAHTLGIETKVKAMDASAKAMLRYNYILEQTAMIEGDFVRTQNTWANQTRILQQRWKQLLITMGNGLITILTPAVKAINAFIQKMIDFANAIGAIIGRIFGIKWQQMSADTGGVADSFGDLGNMANDAADGVDNVGKSAKKAGKKVKNNLAPFDDLQVLMQKTADGAGDADDALNGLKIPELDLDDYGGRSGINGGEWLFGDIDSLFGLGRWLSQKLTEMLENIDWESIYEGARRFGRGLADFLNGLITPELFYQVGRTIANALNTAIYAALTFGEEFNWTNLGRSIAAGINGFFENFDFSALARTINVWVHGILDTIIKVLDDTNWKLIGTKIGQFLSEIDWVGILKKVCIVIGKAFQAAFQVVKNMFKVAPIETLLISFGLLAKFLTSSVFLQATKALQTFGTFLTALGTGAAATRAITQLRGISPILAGIVDAVAGIQLAWEAAVVAFESSSGVIAGTFSGIAAFFNTTSALIPPLVKGIGGLVAGVLEFVGVFTEVKEAFLQLEQGATFIDLLKDHFLTLTTVIAGAAAALMVLFGVPAGLIIAGIVAAVAAIGGFISAMNEIDATAIENAFASVVTSVEGASHTLDDYLIVFDNVTSRVTEGIDEINETFKNLDKSREEVKQTTDVIGTISLAMESERQLTEDQINQLGAAFGQLNEELTGYVSQYYDAIIAQTKADYEYVKSIQGDTESLRTEYANRIQSLYEAKGAAEAEVQTISNEANAAYENYVKVVGDATSSTDDIAAAQQQLHDASLKIIDSSLQVSHNTSEMDEAIKSAKDSFDDLEGSLNLATYGIEHTDDAVAATKGALGEMGDTYSNAKDTITTELDRINTALQTATGIEKTELESQKQVAETRLGELNGAYATGLSGIEKDVLKFIPGMVGKLESDWETHPDWWKAFHPKDEWVKSEMETWIGQIYGEEGIQGSLRTAWAELDGAVAPDAEAAANEILDAFFGPMEVTKSTAYGNRQVTVEGLKEDWKTTAGSIMDGALEGVDEKAEEVVTEINKPFEDSIKTVRGTLQSHSPSVVFHDIGVDIMLGAEQGLDAESPNFITKVQQVTQNAIEAFSQINLTQAITTITTSINTIITNAGQSLKTTLIDVSTTTLSTIQQQWEQLPSTFEQVFLEIETQVTTTLDLLVQNIITNYLGYDAWLLMFQEGPLLALTDFFTLFSTEFDTQMQTWWNTHLLPWFADTKWQTAIYTPWFTFLKAKWKNLLKWWDDEAIKPWWEKHLLVWFKDEKWQKDIYEPWFTYLSQTKWTNLMTWWDTSMQDWWEKKVIPWFKQDKWEKEFDHVYDAAEKTGEKTRDKIKKLAEETEDIVHEACTNMKGWIEEVIEELERAIALAQQLQSMNKGGGGGNSSGNSSNSGSNSGGGSNSRTFMPMLDIFHFEDNLGMSAFRFPELATGAVIPPNKPFMAMLGDQRNGTNIETPLNTMLEAFRSALAEYNNTSNNAIMEVDGETFARLMLPYMLGEMNRQGYNTEIIEGT